MEQQPQKPLEHKTGTLGGLSNRWHGAHGRGRGTVLGAHSRGEHRIKDNGATSPPMRVLQSGGSMVSA